MYKSFNVRFIIIVPPYVTRGLEIIMRYHINTYQVHVHADRDINIIGPTNQSSWYILCIKSDYHDPNARLRQNELMIYPHGLFIEVSSQVYATPSYTSCCHCLPGRSRWGHANGRNL